MHTNVFVCVCVHSFFAALNPRKHKVLQRDKHAIKNEQFAWYSTGTTLCTCLCECDSPHTADWDLAAFVLHVSRKWVTIFSAISCMTASDEMWLNKLLFYIQASKPKFCPKKNTTWTDRLHYLYNMDLIWIWSLASDRSSRPKRKYVKPLWSSQNRIPDDFATSTMYCPSHQLIN